MKKPIETLAAQLPSPCYAVDRALLQRNLDILNRVQLESGATIILALKGFAMHASFPQLRTVLKGTTASSLNEALLGAQQFGGEVHVYAVAYSNGELPTILKLANHISFNSLSQWYRYKEQSLAAGVSCGLRINPEYSEVKTELYNPCKPGSRFGMTAKQLEGADLSGLSGLHFHTLCEQNSDTLERTLQHVEEKFGPLLHQMQWLNMGGGHHITREDYDVERLIRLVQHMRATYELEIILEPGEAIALNTGYLVSTVLDIIENDVEPIAILDVSATAHMPDVLEMPYRPVILGGDEAGVKAHTYLLGGNTCLAGDEIGRWSFDKKLQVGDQLIFTDMAHYTMVKNNTFNGVNLPAIALFDSRDGSTEVVRQFAYEDYKNRLS